MSLSLLIWLILFLVLSAASFVRASYAVALYMLTFFLSPPFWWWGTPIAGYRWNLSAGLILMAAVGMSSLQSFANLESKIRLAFKIALLMAVNATLVHFLIAGGSEISSDSYTLLLKFLLFFFLIFATVKTETDFRLVLAAVIVGAAYIGYEVTFNDRGHIESNRLEGIGAPGATTANHFASLMVTVLPLVAPFFLSKKLGEKCFAIITAPLILNVILLCNSRGAFLAAIISAFVFLASAPRGIRRKAWVLIIAGSFATFLLMGDARILERFVTTFVSEEDRDSSAQSRIEFAKAGLAMVGDHPLGAGGDGFKKVHGVKYLRKLGIANQARSIHNGFINEACEWGIQGFLLRIGLFGTAMLVAWQTLRRPELETNEAGFDKLAACSLLSGCSAFLVTSLFGDHFDSEWGLWLVVLLLAYVALNPEESEAPFDEDGGDAVVIDSPTKGSDAASV